jgi:4-alpha-glucanotransferase
MSRRSISPLYLRIEDIEEFQELDSSERNVVTALGAPLRVASTTPALIDRDAVWAAKRAALEKIHRVPLRADRQGALNAFRQGRGQALEDWATWCAIAERYGSDYRTWPSTIQRPHSAEVAALRRELAASVEFHVWVQAHSRREAGRATPRRRDRAPARA